MAQRLHPPMDLRTFRLLIATATASLVLAAGVIAWQPADGRGIGLLIVGAFYLACAGISRSRRQRRPSRIQPFAENVRFVPPAFSRTLSV